MILGNSIVVLPNKDDSSKPQLIVNLYDLLAS